MDLAEDLRVSLQEILVQGQVEIRESDGRISPGGPLSWEVRGTSERPLLHLWSENCNVTRRVLAITHNTEDRLALAVERFGRLKPERLEIVSLPFARGAREVSRLLRPLAADPGGTIPRRDDREDLRCRGPGAFPFRELCARDRAPLLLFHGYSGGS